MAGAGYSLIPPHPRAYDPTDLEKIYAQKLGNPDYSPGLYLGHMQLAQQDRQDASAAYDRQLTATNAQQYDLGLRKIAQDNFEARAGIVKTGMQYPGAAPAFGLSRAEIAEGMLPNLLEQRDADLESTRAGAFRDRGQGYKLLSDSGVAAPMGAAYDPKLGTTTSTLRQGQRPDITISQNALAGDRARASASGQDIRQRDGLNLFKQYNDINEQATRAVEVATAQIMEAARPKLASDGTTIVPPSITPAQAKQEIAEATARIREGARQQQQSLRQGAERLGMGRVLPDAADYSGGGKLVKPNAAGDNSGGNKAPLPNGSPQATPAPQAPPTARVPDQATATPTVGSGGGPTLTTGGAEPSTRAQTPAPVTDLDGQLRALGTRDTRPIRARVANELSRRGLPRNHPVAANGDGSVSISDGRGGVLTVVK